MKKQVKPLALVGMPGGGKSTVGRQLAKRLGWPFRDTDSMIEERTGESVRAFFEREGEARFRELEQEVLAELLSTGPSVVATGGGVVTGAQNRRMLRDQATVVYLHSLPEEIFRRIRNDRKRPLLQVADPAQKLKELYAQRDPWYREVATFIVETGRPSVSTLVNMIMMQLELAGVVEIKAQKLARPSWPSRAS